MSPRRWATPSSSSSGCTAGAGIPSARIGPMPPSSCCSLPKPLRTVRVGDVQAWMDTLEHLAPASRARKISSVKSLFAFGHRLGYLPFDVDPVVVKRPRLKDTLTERILSEGDVHRLLAQLVDLWADDGSQVA